jgi:hypothetical protein
LEDFAGDFFGSGFAADLALCASFAGAGLLLAEAGDFPWGCSAGVFAAGFVAAAGVFGAAL